MGTEKVKKVKAEKVKVEKGMKWHEAIVQVMTEAGAPMHYTAIAAVIKDKGLRKKLGKTPQFTVNARITANMKAEKGGSVFVKVEGGKKGEYALRKVA